MKVGMKAFAQLGLINMEEYTFLKNYLKLILLFSPKSIAEFFKNTPNLSKEKIGEYFGEEPEFNIKVRINFYILN